VIRIRTSTDIERYLNQLVETDSRLEPIRAIAGPLPLRLAKPDFAGLADIVVSQHVSKHSAAAIMQRLRNTIDPLTPENFVATPNERLIEVGLTRAKQQALYGLANAISTRQLDLMAICQLPADEAIAQLSEHKGVGPWTAEVFLLFCGGRTDVFPAGDVALRTAIGDAFNIEPRPSVQETRAISEQWAPLGGVAARLFWAYYAVRKDQTNK
jgi:DNA-3-methyladenine glycosylase II